MIMKSKPQHVARTAKNIAQDPRWAAVIARDPVADDKFVYAVKTTGTSAVRRVHARRIRAMEGDAAADAGSIPTPASKQIQEVKRIPSNRLGTIWDTRQRARLFEPWTLVHQNSLRNLCP
jgi:hypothetical protein